MKLSVGDGLKCLCGHEHPVVVFRLRANGAGIVPVVECPMFPQGKSFPALFHDGGLRTIVEVVIRQEDRP